VPVEEAAEQARRVEPRSTEPGDNGSGERVAGRLIFEISVGVEYNAEGVIHASPNDEYGIWGSDLRAELILSGETDWLLVERIWSTLTTLWSAVAWDEMSGFEINKDAPKLA
jgi:hypothetical protein